MKKRNLTGIVLMFSNNTEIDVADVQDEKLVDSFLNSFENINDLKKLTKKLISVIKNIGDDLDIVVQGNDSPRYIKTKKVLN